MACAVESEPVEAPPVGAAALFGQTSAGVGGISGVVTDPSGAIVEGATVVVENPELGIRRELKTTGGGVFNASGPDYTLTMQALLEACREASASDARFTWVAEQFLLEKGVQPWGDIPLWIPEASDKRCFLAENCERAWAAGLTFRPLVETARDTLAWQSSGSPGFEKEGLVAHEQPLTPEREEELLREWQGKNDEA